MGVKPSYSVDRAWADNHINAINDVVRRVAGRIITIEESEPRRDLEEAIDYEIKVASGEMACRIRRADRYPFRDLTMTCDRPSGVRPETDKILDGKVRWYLYAWAREGVFVDWMFVDLDVVRREKLIEGALETSRPKKTSDGSSFICIPYQTLIAANAILEADIKNVTIRRAS